jgi:predicted  nucleic acid-binding Zn-ribbon protein
MTNAADLFALQEIDLALDSAIARLAEIEAELGETQELIDARAVVEDKQVAVTALRSRQKDLEWAVDEIRIKTTAVEEKLYGGSVRNPKELSDLDADLKSLKTQLRFREDDLLTLLVEIDDAEAELAGARTAYAEIESLWREGQKRLQNEKSEIEPEVVRLQADRNQDSATIDRASLGLYQLLRERRGGRAVARVERGMCQGCRITLPMSVLQKARAGMALVQCVSCERMLLVS